MRPKWARPVEKALPILAGELTSRGRVRVLGELGREPRVEGLRAVAMRRWPGDLEMREARAAPRPVEQPVTGDSQLEAASKVHRMETLDTD